MSSEQRQILLKTDTKTITLELGREGKFVAKATGWDEYKFIKPGEKIEISVVHGRGPVVKAGAALIVSREVVGPRCRFRQGQM